VEEDSYGLDLVRYLPLNPLRAQIMWDLRTLDRYPATGHSALLGTVARSWRETRTILGQFGSTPPRARAGIAYPWVERLGHPERPLAPVLGLHPAAVCQAGRREAAQAGRDSGSWGRGLRRHRLQRPLLHSHTTLGTTSPTSVSARSAQRSSRFA